MGDKSIPDRDWAGTGRKKNVNGKQKYPIKDFPEEAAAARKKGPGKLRQMQRFYKKGGKV